MAELILDDIAPSDCLEGIIDLSLAAARYHLLIVRISTALDLGAQCGGRRASVLEREHGVAADRVLDRLAIALAAAAAGPRRPAARLDDEVQAVAIEHFLPRGGWFPGLDIQACEFHQSLWGSARGSKYPR